MIKIMDMLQTFSTCILQSLTFTRKKIKSRFLTFFSSSRTDCDKSESLLPR